MNSLIASSLAFEPALALKLELLQKVAFSLFITTLLKQKYLKILF